MITWKKYFKTMLLVCFFFSPILVHADMNHLGSLEAVTVNTNSNGEQSYSLSIQILLAMGFITLLPGLLLSMTAFTRIIIVLSILRQAIGMPQTPTNQILIGVSLFLTFFIMAPVFHRIDHQAIQPLISKKITFNQAVEKAQGPMRQFMLNQTRTRDIDFFSEIYHSKKNDRVSFFVLMPAFLTSELKTAFQIGFMIFLPFLIIDLVVAAVLMAMGMMMLSPLIVSLPFKIMLFVLVDGWTMIMVSLVSSFN